MKSKIAQMARVQRLLVASDFDGTLAAIAPQPHLASPVPRAMEILRSAARLPQTCVAIVSGRALADLRSRLGALPGAWFVGGHGAEISGPNITLVPQDYSRVLDAVAAALRGIAPPGEGYLHERKPAGIAVHFRGVDARAAADAVDRVTRLASSHAGLILRHGKMVVEVLAADTNKGVALRALKRSTGATGVVFFGDDVTDEDGFRELGERDLAIKIGDGATDADFSVSSLDEAHALLSELVDAREAWLREVRRPSIQDYSILSDLRTIAVVSPGGVVEWLCLPRADGSGVFSSLIGEPSMGQWSIASASDPGPPSQRYLGSTLTLETCWPSVRVVDYLDGSAGRTFQRAGRTDLVRVVEGTGRALVRFAPRLDFGRARTKLLVADGGLLVEGGSDPLVLCSPGVEWVVTEADGSGVATAELDLGARSFVLELRAGTRSLVPAKVPEANRREQTAAVWNQWARSLTIPRVESDLCRRSALVLRALVHGPTGALLAAGTTSLPETAGGARNWDYRFCWPRDAAVACAALVRLGNLGVAMKYLDWLLGVVDRCAGPERLRPIYSVTGEELGAEAELSHLSGYRSSQPVRVGNAAARQVQLDVFGPIVELISLLSEAGAAISPDHWRLVEAMTTAVERSWREPDHGIWEVRTDKRHHVHTKVMCWLALDRAVRLADHFAGPRRDSWISLRDLIREEILVQGFDEGLGGFVAAYDLREPDASALSVGLTGMIGPDDPRFTGTVELVRSRLLDRGTVSRYRYDDGLPGPEGGFHLCTGWLVESLVMIGALGEARALFESLCKAAGATGLMCEQWCPVENTGLGNTPQAYSHAAVINAAVALASVEG